jgi:hypothetical protein
LTNECRYLIPLTGFKAPRRHSKTNAPPRVRRGGSEIEVTLEGNGRKDIARPSRIPPAGLVTAAAIVVAQAKTGAAVEPPMAAGLAARRLAAALRAARLGAAAVATVVFAARRGTRLLAGHHPAAGHRLLVRNADGHGAGRLVGDLPGAPHLVRLGPLFGDALAARHLALLLTRLGVVDRHLAGDRTALADALAAGDRVLFPRGARHPAADGLHWLAARLAAGVAARVAAAMARIAAVVAAAVAAMEAALEPAAETVAAIAAVVAAARDLPAFPVAAINAAAARGRDRLVADALLHDGALFHGRDAHAHRAGYGPGLGDSLPHRAGARPGFRIAFALVRGVGLLAALGAIARASAGVGLGDPFGVTTGRRITTRRRTTAVVASLSGDSRRCRYQPGRNDENTALPDHAFSFARKKSPTPTGPGQSGGRIGDRLGLHDRKL